MSDEDQRVHARLIVSTDVSVVAGDGSVITAQLKDLSKGGARFLAPIEVGEVGDTIGVLLPSLDDETAEVSAAIIRSVPVAGGYMVAVRFDFVDPGMQESLLGMIDVLLSASGGGARRHARVARRIEIRYGGDLTNLGAILEDISHGGLSMTVSTPLVLFEEVSVTVPDTVGDEMLILRARVVNQRAIGHVDGQGPRYRVGLEFTSLRPETRRCLEVLLEFAQVAPDDDGGAGQE